MVDNIVILAGGSGTRLWPASRRARPKQFLDLGTGTSLFSQTLKRALNLEVKGKIVVITHESHIDAICEEIAGFNETFETAKEVIVVGEPHARNTAPAIGLACNILTENIGSVNTAKKGESVIVLPADHVIRDMDSFKSDAEKASNIAEIGMLVTFGIKPSRPETGYGYIEIDGELMKGFRVLKFHEKPDLERAEFYLKSGKYYWNSGIFTFRVDVMTEELKKYAEEIYEILIMEHAETIFEVTERVAGKGKILIYRPNGNLVNSYNRLPSISIDYAVMEKTERAAMVPASFDWSDVGSWDEVARIFGDVRGRFIFEHESKGNYVLSDIPVALVGVTDLIVVKTRDALLVCRKGESQFLKNIVSKIENEGKEELL